MTKPRKGVKGPLVILVLGIAIVATASTAFLGTWLFDSEREKRIDKQNEQLALEAEKAWDAYSEKHNRGDPDVAQDVEGLDLYYAAFEHEERKQALGWNQLIDKFRGYPFTDAPGNEFPLRSIGDALRPGDGLLWQHAAQIDDLTAIEVGSKRVAAPPPNYQDTLRKAEAIRDALFPHGGQDVEVHFEARVTGGTLTFGEQTVTDEFTTLHWKPEITGAVLTDDNGEILDFTNSDWGMLRVVSSCEPAGAGKFKFGTAVVELKVEGENPFDPALYSLPEPD